MSLESIKAESSELGQREARALKTKRNKDWFANGKGDRDLFDGNVIAALSMPGPTHRMPPQRLREIADALVEACNAISAHVLRA